MAAIHAGGGTPWPVGSGAAGKTRRWGQPQKGQRGRLQTPRWPRSAAGDEPVTARKSIRVRLPAMAAWPCVGKYSRSNGRRPDRCRRNIRPGSAFGYRCGGLLRFVGGSALYLRAGAWRKTRHSTAGRTAIIREFILRQTLPLFCRTRFRGAIFVHRHDGLRQRQYEAHHGSLLGSGLRPDLSIMGLDNNA